MGDDLGFEAEEFYTRVKNLPLNHSFSASEFEGLSLTQLRDLYERGRESATLDPSFRDMMEGVYYTGPVYEFRVLRRELDNVPYRESYNAAHGVRSFTSAVDVPVWEGDGLSGESIMSLLQKDFDPSVEGSDIRFVVIGEGGSFVRRNYPSEDEGVVGSRRSLTGGFSELMSQDVYSYPIKLSTGEYSDDEIEEWEDDREVIEESEPDYRISHNIVESVAHFRLYNRPHLFKTSSYKDRMSVMKYCISNMIDICEREEGELGFDKCIECLKREIKCIEVVEHDAYGSHTFWKLYDLPE